MKSDDGMLDCKLHVVLQNFGILKYAEIDVDKLTVVCGKNNMGKTYATYAFYGFLDFWRRGFSWRPESALVRTLANDHQLTFTFDQLVELVLHAVNDASSLYSSPETLSEVFGSDSDFFSGSVFKLSLGSKFVRLQLERALGEAGKAMGKGWIVTWEMDEKGLHYSFGDEGVPEDGFSAMTLIRILSDSMKKVVFSKILPMAAISCAERTGAVIFQKELDFTRNRIVEMLGDQETQKFSSMLFFRHFSARYPLPIRRNVDTARKMPEGSKSFLTDGTTPGGVEVMRLFCDIIGGEYKVVKGELRFVPREGKALKLDMVLSSSSVRALMHLGVYLMFQAQRGDVLILDEPEQNLHPSNQRKMARLIARLVRLGVRVFITTHSDYIVREFNNLIMLNRKGKVLDGIRKKHAYSTAELLDSKEVSVYHAGKKPCLVPGNKIRSNVHTLIAADVDPELGIEAVTFDETINDMNQLQEEIMFAGECDD